MNSKNTDGTYVNHSNTNNTIINKVGIMLNVIQIIFMNTFLSVATSC